MKSSEKVPSQKQLLKNITNGLKALEVPSDLIERINYYESVFNDPGYIENRQAAHDAYNKKFNIK